MVLVWLFLLCRIDGTKHGEKHCSERSGCITTSSIHCAAVSNTLHKSHSLYATIVIKAGGDALCACKEVGRETICR